MKRSLAEAYMKSKGKSLDEYLSGQGNDEVAPNNDEFLSGQGSDEMSDVDSHILEAPHLDDSPIYKMLRKRMQK